MAKADPERFVDLFASFGRIEVRRMFGGEGLFVDGLMIGLVMKDRLYLKTDVASKARYLAEGLEPFSFEKNGKTIATGYYAIPERLYDDPEGFAQWARQAHEVARTKAKT